MASSSRVFKGCRVLFAASKAATPSPAAKKKVAAAVTPAAEKKKKPRAPSGLTKVMPISPALRNFLGVPESARHDAIKKTWDYIKLHNLQNPNNKKEIFCDDKLKMIFEGKEKVTFFEVSKMLSPHFVKN